MREISMFFIRTGYKLIGDCYGEGIPTMSSLFLRRQLEAVELVAQELAVKARDSQQTMEIEEVETLMHDLVSAFADLKVTCGPSILQTRH